MTDRGFLVQVRVEPADERHCDRTGHWCQMMGGAYACNAFPGIKLDCAWGQQRVVERGESYPATLRCPECVAAEKEARDEA